MDITSDIESFVPSKDKQLSYRFFETASTPKVFTAIQVSFMEVGNCGSIATHTPLIGYFCAATGKENRIRACTHKSGMPMDLAMSALPSEADIRAGLQDVCFVP